MNALLYVMARFYEVRAERARASATRLEASAEKLFLRLGIKRPTTGRGRE